MKVYIVSTGERSEGSRVVGVFTSMDSATDAALAVKPCFDGGWQPSGENSWMNGCDFVSIQEFEVKPC